MILLHIFNLACMYAKHPTKNNIFLCFREGQHRLGGITQALTGRKLNSVDGVISKNARLTTDIFVKNQLTPKMKDNDTVDFQEALQSILSSEEKPAFSLVWSHCESLGLKTTWRLSLKLQSATDS